jgi:AraC-like DNA-binding protein
MESIKIDELYFHSKSKAMYYVLGAWYPSGRTIKKKYIKKDKSKSVYKGIEFGDKSKKLVEIVRDELQSTSKPAPWGGRGPSWVLNHHNTNTLCDKLEELGLDADKYEREFPKIPGEYVSHFVRGFLDAQAIIKRTKGKTSIKIQFSETFLRGLDKIFVKYLHIKPSQSKNGFRVYGNEASRKIYDFIYEDWPYIEARGVYLPSKKRLFVLDNFRNQIKLETLAKEEVKMKKAKPLLAKDMPIHQVATRLGFKYQSHFKDIFKKVTGMTPSEYKNSCPNIIAQKAEEERAYKIIKDAKRLLAKDINVSEVASQLGFNHSLFTEYFKEHTGKTPSDYQNSHGWVIKSRQARIDENIRKAKALLAKDMRVYDVADALGLNKKDFTELFKGYTGQNPAKYRNSHYSVIVKRRTEKKLERGLSMLRKGKRWQNVARNLGYSRPESFYKLVLRHEGVTPAEYQRQYQPEVA